MLLYVLLVGSVLACLVFILLMLMLDSDVTTGYYDKFGGRLDQYYAGKVPERLSYPVLWTGLWMHILFFCGFGSNSFPNPDPASLKMQIRIQPFKKFVKNNLMQSFFTYRYSKT